MNILTIGGATQDILLQYDGIDLMSISQPQGTQSYLLFEAGAKIEVESITHLSGGGATNVAVSFRRQGFSTTCICAVGNDEASKHILQDLAQENVCTKYIKQIPSAATGTSYIVTSLHNDRTIFTYRGANTLLSTTDINEEVLSNASYIYITSLSGNAAHTLPAITSLAKKHCVPVAINPGKSQLASNPEILKESLKDVDILILNSTEAKQLMATLTNYDKSFHQAFNASSSKNPCALNQPDNAAYLLDQPIACQGMFFSLPNFFSTILNIGPRIVVVTNGANGVYASSKKTMYFHPSIRVPVINTVGAGDAFGSAFVGSLLNGATIEKALQHGIINSASVLSHVGAKAGLLTMATLEEQVQKIDLTIKTFNL